MRTQNDLQCGSDCFFMKGLIAFSGRLFHAALIAVRCCFAGYLVPVVEKFSIVPVRLFPLGNTFCALRLFFLF